MVPLPLFATQGKACRDGALDIPSKAARKCARSGAWKCGGFRSNRYVWDNVMQQRSLRLTTFACTLSTNENKFSSVNVSTMLGMT